MDVDRVQALDEAIARLSPEDRAGLRDAGREVARLLVLARKVMVLPVLILVLWPPLLPWMLWTAVRVLAVRRRPAIAALLSAYGDVPFDDVAGARRQMLQAIEDPDRRGYLGLQQAPLTFALALLLTPTLVVIIAVWLAHVLGRG